MQNGNGRPLGIRKKVQLLLALTILAWATQTLFHQWGYGAEAPAAEKAKAGDAAAPQANEAAAPQTLKVVTPASNEPGSPQEKADAAPAPAAERFVPDDAFSSAGATLEFRSEATVYGPEIRFKQVCRWQRGDEAAFASTADLVLARFDAKASFKILTIKELRQTLHDAGVNLAIIRFAGTTSCTITRGDANFDEGAALEQWVNARQAAADEKKPENEAESGTDKADRARAMEPEAKMLAVSGGVPDQGTSPVRTLREALTGDLCTRLNLKAEQAQLSFDPQDDKVLNLAEPQFKFNLDAKRVRDLGKVSWEVTIVTDSGSKKVPINAVARAWQNQVVVGKPLTYRQVIRAEDITERRILADRMPDDTLLTPSQIIGQQAARDMKSGVVVSAKMVEAVPLAKTGQFISVSLVSGSVRVKTVGRAMESGSYGQTIRVKNEATRDIYQVILTGPQEASMNPDDSTAKVASAREE